MRLALRLARRGYGRTSPNPMVGAVLVKGGKILGQGWHRRAGKAHAEIEALRDARKRGRAVKGATLYGVLVTQGNNTFTKNTAKGSGTVDLQDSSGDADRPDTKKMLQLIHEKYLFYSPCFYSRRLFFPKQQKKQQNMPGEKCQHFGIFYFIPGLFSNLV